MGLDPLQSDARPRLLERPRFAHSSSFSTGCWQPPRFQPLRSHPSAHSLSVRAEVRVEVDVASSRRPADPAHTMPTFPCGCSSCSPRGRALFPEDVAVAHRHRAPAARPRVGHRRAVAEDARLRARPRFASTTPPSIDSAAGVRSPSWPSTSRSTGDEVAAAAGAGPARGRRRRRRRPPPAGGAARPSCHARRARRRPLELGGVHLGDRHAEAARQLRQFLQPVVQQFELEQRGAVLSGDLRHCRNHRRRRRWRADLAAGAAPG